MDNTALLKKTFTKALGIEEQLVTDSLTYNGIPQWDSVAHMILIKEIEDEFSIMLDTMDIIDMSSFQQSKEILKKYNISF